jgi:hypothetical protein
MLFVPDIMFTSNDIAHFQYHLYVRFSIHRVILKKSLRLMYYLWLALIYVFCWVELRALFRMFIYSTFFLFYLLLMKQKIIGITYKNTI